MLQLRMSTSHVLLSLQVTQLESEPHLADQQPVNPRALSTKLWFPVASSCSQGFWPAQSTSYSLTGSHTASASVRVDSIAAACSSDFDAVIRLTTSQQTHMLQSSMMDLLLLSHIMAVSMTVSFDLAWGLFHSNSQHSALTASKPARVTSPYSPSKPGNILFCSD